MKYKRLNRKQKYEISAHLALKDMQDKAQGGVLYTHCRHRLKHRKCPMGRVAISPQRVSIHEIPYEAKWKRLGDFEIDLIVGTQGKG